MLSKMARPETNYEGLVCFKLEIKSDLQSCYIKSTVWQKTISNGRVITLEVNDEYAEANAYIYTTALMANYIRLNNSREPSLRLDNYDGDIEPTKPCINRVMKIDGIELDHNKLVASGQFTSEEATEIYRNVVKWDIIPRDKSSDSESESDSECDTKKLQKNEWKYSGEKNIIVGTFDICRN